MRREGRQALLNALLIANICIHCAEHRQLRAARRNEQANLRHQRKHAHSLQRYRLTTGVRAGNQKHRKPFAKLHIQRHNRILIEQRMTSLRNLYAAVHRQQRTHSVLLLRQQRLRTDNVERREGVQRSQKLRCLRAHVLRKLTQNTLHLFMLLCKITLDIIIEVHHRQRLDEQRSASAALVMHNAGEVHLILLLDRDNITVATHRHDIIHKIFLIVGVMQNAVQLLLHAILGNLNRRAQAVELR